MVPARRGVVAAIPGSGELTQRPGRRLLDSPEEVVIDRPAVSGQPRLIDTQCRFNQSFILVDHLYHVHRCLRVESLRTYVNVEAGTGVNIRSGMTDLANDGLEQFEVVVAQDRGDDLAVLSTAQRCVG